MMGGASKKQAIHSIKFNRSSLKQFLMHFSNAVAIAIRRRISDIGNVEPSFETVEARLRAAQGRSFRGEYVCEV